jgi:hypothetical protein
MISTAFSPVAYSYAPQGFGSKGKFEPPIEDFKDRNAVAAALVRHGHQPIGGAKADTGFKEIKAGVPNLTEGQKRDFQEMLGNKHKIVYED